MEPVTFGALAITQLLIATNTISFLSNHFVLAELFCGETLQYSGGTIDRRTYIELSIEKIPDEIERCILRTRDKIGNIYTRIIVL